MTTIEIPATSQPTLSPSGKGHDVTWWAMVLVCITEGCFFAYCITTYFYLGGRNPAWPPAGIEKPPLHIPIIMTILLLASSVTLWWGEHGLRRNAVGRFWGGLIATIILGAAFLLLQWREYHNKIQEIIPQTHAYASVFYTTTGFHGAHVAFGLLMLLLLVLRTLQRPEPGGLQNVTEVISLYWHFVDGVWLVIFTSFYLSPHF